MEAASTILRKEVADHFAGVKIGDLVLIESFPPESENEGGDEEGKEEGDQGQQNAKTEAGATDGENESAVPASSASASEQEVDGGDDEEASPDDDGEGELRDYTEDLYYVSNVTKDNATGAILDVTVVKLHYCAQPAQATSLSYHIYGTETTHNVTNAQKFDSEESVKELTFEAETKNYLCRLNPHGDLMKDVASPHRRCPLPNCADGFLPSHAELTLFLPATIASTLTTVTHYSPLCPSCMGLALTQEYHNLHSMLDTAPFGTLDLGIVVEFYGRLNPRRKKLGYRFRQFDEREWGYIFDDINSEDEDEDDESDGGDENAGWGYYAEAMDPSACVVLRPACEEFIAALPRKLFSEVSAQSTYSNNNTDELAEGAQKNQAVSDECTICKEQFSLNDNPELIVVELPCGHVFCDAGCIQTWLGQFNNCPTCRAKMPEKKAKKETDKAPVAADLGAVAADGEDEQSGDGAVAENSNEEEQQEQEMDGEDTVMSDIDVDVKAVVSPDDA